MLKTLAFILVTACATTAPPPPVAATSPHREGLRIKLTTVYVDDQDRALHFYTDVLGFTKKDDVRKGPFRWLTVTADADGAALQLAPDANPAAKAYQQAMFEQNQPATMFYTDDVKREYERIKARGGEFTMPPTEVMPGVTIAMVKDTCGNLIQISQIPHE